METKVKSLVKNVLQNIKEKKESRMAFLYSIFYFVFITILLVFSSVSWAQKPIKFSGRHNAVRLAKASMAEFSSHHGVFRSGSAGREQMETYQ